MESEAQGVKRSPSHFCSSASPAEVLHAQPPASLLSSSISISPISPPTSPSPSRLARTTSYTLARAISCARASVIRLSSPHKPDCQTRVRSPSDYPSLSPPSPRPQLSASQPVSVSLFLRRLRSTAHPLPRSGRACRRALPQMRWDSRRPILTRYGSSHARLWLTLQHRVWKKLEKGSCSAARGHIVQSR